MVAHGRWPYVYYENFRWVITITALACAYLLRSKPLVVALCVAVALVFNPIAPPRMRAYQWQRYDVLAAIVMFGVAVYAGYLRRAVSRK